MTCRCGVLTPRARCYFCTATLERMGQSVEGETELGFQRYCRRCAEWWPLTAEFWYWYVAPRRRIVCKACHNEAQRVAYERRKAQSWTHIVDESLAPAQNVVAGSAA